METVRSSPRISLRTQIHPVDSRPILQSLEVSSFSARETFGWPSERYCRRIGRSPRKGRLKHRVGNQLCSSIRHNVVLDKANGMSGPTHADSCAPRILEGRNRQRLPQPEEMYNNNNNNISTSVHLPPFLHVEQLWRTRQSSSVPSPQSSCWLHLSFCATHLPLPHTNSSREHPVSSGVGWDEFLSSSVWNLNVFSVDECIFLSRVFSWKSKLKKFKRPNTRFIVLPKRNCFQKRVNTFHHPIWSEIESESIKHGLSKAKLSSAELS